MKYLIEDTTLTAIGDAVRTKGNTSDLIKVSELANAITNLPSGGGGDIEVEPIVLTGYQDYGCAGDIASNYIKLFGNTISTNDITGCQFMFNNYKNDTIPFDINCKSGVEININSMFSYSNIKFPPRVINCKVNSQGAGYQFNGCEYLIEIPEDFADTWDWSSYNSITYSNGGNTFNACHRLRRVASNFLSNNYGGNTSTYSSPYYNTFNNCHVLDEVKDLAVAPVNYTSNAFNNTFGNCSRLKNMTFCVNEDGTPKTANWSNQTIDYSSGYGVGYYNGNLSVFLNYTDFSADKEVKDDATYQALKDDPDWFTVDVNYSRYNHTSAVNTINSLPDTSAYGTNTIKFKGVSGALTDGGAINTMTEEEIAVATAKGWTVSFS